MPIADQQPAPTAHPPLTLGTAGHVDHGKTTLVAALTGVDTDRLPEEKARGLTIRLGYAPLMLPSGRRLSLIDVPGHSRFVRTMVSGATGVDLFLMVIAADDGVMPQTIEHAAILHALDVQYGVIAITKADIAASAAASAEAAALLPGVPIVACSARTRVGLDELLALLERTVANIPSRATELSEAARMHLDRVFTITGRGTVVTGTLWSGCIAQGDTLELLPSRKSVRIRGIEIHGAAAGHAYAGQRVAVNLAGIPIDQVGRGDVLATPGEFRETSVLDCALEIRHDVRQGGCVQVLHGTRHVAARVTRLDDGFWQLRLEHPIVAAAGDRLVIRRLAPAGTIGGGRVVDALARRHGPRPEIAERLSCLLKGSEPPARAATDDVAAAVSVPAARDSAVADDLERRLREATTRLLSEAQCGSPIVLRRLRNAGIAVRVSGRLYGHTDTVSEIRQRIVALIKARGPVTLAAARDELGISRKATQAFLEHLDSLRVTRRLADDTRVLTPGATRNPEPTR